MATLRIMNNWQLTFGGALNGRAQGDVTTPFFEPFGVTVDPQTKLSSDVLVPPAVLCIWSQATHRPADFDYLWIKSNVAVYLQLIGATSQVILPLTASLPFVLAGSDQLLAAGNTTDLAAEPTLEDIVKVNVGNFGGSNATLDYLIVD